ncbi:hypothetical protein LJR164_002258 [Phenylobacterium sp. LjRoot164]|uniref:hypothetical protein n=1 Tax=unclassified Phenylobacterium TaxID=2640670 RepID=UPI003ECE284F
MQTRILVSLFSVLAAGAGTPSAVRAAPQIEVNLSGGESFGGLIAQQSASDRMNAELDEVVRAAVARGEAERRSRSASRPIQTYLESAKAPVVDEASASAVTPDDIPPLVEKHLLLMEGLERENLQQDEPTRGQVDAYARARVNGVAIKLRTAGAIESWGRLVVIVPPGEVIENDPMDVAHARLEDLTRRREELQAELKTKPTSASMRSILRELAGIDRQINAAIFQITGVVWFQRAGKGSICHPTPVKGRPVAWFNCDYWALSTPFVVDPSGENIIVDRVLLDITEDTSGLRSARIAYYTRGQGQPPSDQPSNSAAGDFRYLADGTVQLIVKEVDDGGEERERAYPVQLSTDSGNGLIPGFSGHGPFKLKFKRDPKAYISWEAAQEALDNIVPLVGQTPPPKPPPWAVPDEDGIVPLVEPPPKPAPQPTSPTPASPEDYDIPPLVEP